MKEDNKKQAINRLKRIEGQVRGLQKMVEEEKYCIDILTQSNAVKNALLGVDNLILENHLSTHVAEQIKEGETEKVVEEILEVYKSSNKYRK